MRKTLFHSTIALFWVVITALVIWPELDAINEQNAGASLFWLISFISISIILVPQLTRFNLINSFFSWPGAMSAEQKSKLKLFDLRGYYNESKNADYLLKLVPYFKTYIITTTILFVLDFWMFSSEDSIAAIFFLSIECYFVGVLTVMLLSLPLVHLLNQKNNER